MTDRTMFSFKSRDLSDQFQQSLHLLSASEQYSSWMSDAEEIAINHYPSAGVKGGVRKYCTNAECSERTEYFECLALSLSLPSLPIFHKSRNLLGRNEDEE